MKRKDYIEIIPIALLSILGIYSIVEVSTSDYIFLGKQFVGLTLLGICLCLFFINRRLYKYLFGLTLILGLFNLVGFTTSITTMNFLMLPVQILMIPIVGIFAWINQDKIIEKYQSLIGQNEDQITLGTISKVKVFKERFKNLNDSEIERRLESKLLPEAIEALRQIQIDRLSSKKNS